MNSRTAAAGVLTLALLPLAAPARAGAATVAVVVDGSEHRIVFDGGRGGGQRRHDRSRGRGRRSDQLRGYGRDGPADPRRGLRGWRAAGHRPSPAPCRSPFFPARRTSVRQKIRSRTRLEINLGDGDDSLDSRGVPRTDGGTGTLRLVAAGGDGADRFTDGPLAAQFDPGTGADTVSAGSGYDSVTASAGSMDEADVYDLGGGARA